MSLISIKENLSDIDEASWEALLSKSPYGSIFQSRQMANFFDGQKGHVSFVFASYENDRLMALCTGVIMAEAGFVKKQITRRAIIIGGPVIDIENNNPEVIAALLRTMGQKLKGQCIYAEIRNLMDYSNYRDTFEQFGWTYKAHLNFQIKSGEQVASMKTLTSDKRRQVRKSLKAGARIVEAHHHEQVSAFYEILAQLYKTKVKTPLPELSFFTSFLESGMGKLLLIEYQEKIIGGVMCPVFSDRVIYDWYRCGQDRIYKNVYPSVLAAWAAIAYANEQGIQIFDFMGAGSPDKDYGVRDFKAQFGGELVEHGRFTKVFSPVVYKMAEKAVKLLKRKA